jgi:cytochrome c1
MIWSNPKYFCGIGRLRQLIVSAALLVGVVACAQSEVPTDQRVAGADPAAGILAIEAVACGVCHVIPGIPGAIGVVGPSLAGFGRRQLIGGVVPNHPANLIRWVADAPSIAPDTGMPELPLTDSQARDIAAYLFTLR